MVALNRAVAIAEADGADVGLAALDGLELEHYHLFHATRGELLARTGRPDEAVAAFRRALALTANGAEQAHLQRRLADVAGSPPR